jgi:hypothetical protein
MGERQQQEVGDWGGRLAAASDAEHRAMGAGGPDVARPEGGATSRTRRGFPLKDNSGAAENTTEAGLRGRVRNAARYLWAENRSQRRGEEQRSERRRRAYQVVGIAAL